METQCYNNDIIKLQEAINRNDLYLVLQQCYKIKLNKETNEPECLHASNADVKILWTILQKEWHDGNSLVLKESFRCLRNCAIKNLQLQNYIIQQKELLPICKQILIEDKYPLPLRNMVLTFLINICIGNSTNGQIIWNNFHFVELLKFPSILDKVLALAYNVLLCNEEIKPTMEFLIIVLEDVRNSEGGSEYSHFLIDLLIKSAQIFKLYPNIQIADDRILVLQQIKDFQLKKQPIKWSKASIDILTEEFKRKSDCILKTVAEYIEKIEPYEVALLADVIASISSDEQCLKFIQYDRSLLINCAFLLKSIHMAGKQGNNNFAPIGKISIAEELKDEITEHPAFGFRVNMIRILGNLAWKTRCNQDELRELDVIPLLLDCCNIDGRNPFIIQWVVFAIRNLCENNADNQRIIASLNKQGVVDSKMLHELGVTLHDDGENSIKIAPFDVTK